MVTLTLQQNSETFLFPTQPSEPCPSSGVFGHILHHATTLLRLILHRSTCHGSTPSLCTLIFRPAAGHALAHTATPTESSPVGRCERDAPTQFGVHCIVIALTERTASSGVFGRSAAHSVRHVCRCADHQQRGLVSVHIRYHCDCI